MAKKKKSKGKKPVQKAAPVKNKKLIIAGAAAVLAVIAAVVLAVVLLAGSPSVKEYRRKASLLKSHVVTAELQTELGGNPAGDAGYAVFISVCDTAERASVYTGTGEDLKAAWKAADKAAADALKLSGLEPVWVKADVVSRSQKVDQQQLERAVLASRTDFFRYGIAFDEDFGTALLEAELNGNKIYEYEEGGIDLAYLNNYLEKSGRGELISLPSSYTAFRCRGWFCDEEDNVYELLDDDLDYGRRDVETIDAEYVKMLVSNASGFLVDQVKEDGSFVYGMYPRFDNDIENYNIVRHASTIWSLICRYRILPDEELIGVIDSTIEYMLDNMIYDEEGNAYLYEEKDDEVKLGGCGVALITLTEYMDVFDTDKYVDICRKLGGGILTMLDQNGEYYHVLNGDLTRKEEFRTVYYDGEATFGLCRLYGVTGEQVWLDAAQSAVEHFIAADYSQYKDHWIAYSMNEITKHIDDPAYYEFAMHNVQANLETIYERDTTYHTYLELLMVAFETYDRMVDLGIEAEELDKEFFLKTIYTRADRMLNGYFYPEYAMYMENPARVLDTFMVRHDGYRIRIDDVQHNIGGYYMYYKHYDSLVEHGLLECRD